MSQKRRRISSDSTDAHYDKYNITSLSIAKKPVITTCCPDYQIYDISAALEPSRPPYHPAVFIFDKWDAPDVTLHVGKYSHKAHKKHLQGCCRYFEGMFRHQMAESKKSEVTIHGIDQDSFRAILSGFYTGYISLCTKCVIPVWNTATYLMCPSILNICEQYILTHMSLENVFTFFEVSCELGNKRVQSHAIQLICNNLGHTQVESQTKQGNLLECEEFLSLSPDRMYLILDGYKTNCTETELATAIFKWATLQYTVLLGDESLTPENLLPDKDESQAGSSCNDSGIGINISDEYIVEILNTPTDIEYPPLPNYSPDLVSLPPVGDLLNPPTPYPSQESYSAVDFTEQTTTRHISRTYKRRSRRSRTRKPEKRGRSVEVTSDNRGKKRRREADKESENMKRERNQISDIPPPSMYTEIGNVLNQIEYGNMETESLKEFLHLPIVRHYPNLYNYIHRLTLSIQYKCEKERGSKTAISLCYHRCYRSSDSPTRTVVLYYYCNNRWHILNNSFKVNLLTVKSIILHDYLYLFGIQRIPGRPNVPRSFRFNQFTGQWKEIASPCLYFDANARCLVYKDTILLIGVASPGLTTSVTQSEQVRVIQYTPQSDEWHELSTRLPINYYQLHRYVSSIISHRDLLYYVSRNKLYSFNLDEESPRRREVTVVSAMFTDISNYWLFSYQDKIILLGGLCNVEGGGSWENREVLIFSLGTNTWTVIQNTKPSPMYEMMSGMVYQDKIYTVSHGSSGADSIAKMELFDLTKLRWRKGINLKYESPAYCSEYGLNVGCMLVKCYTDDKPSSSNSSDGSINS